jgi:hypothetical protein
MDSPAPAPITIPSISASFKAQLHRLKN